MTWSAPWKVKNIFLTLLPIVNKLPFSQRIIPKKIPVKISTRIRKMGWVGYDWLPYTLGFTIIEAVEMLHVSLQLITCPVFLIQGEKDEVIHRKSARIICNKIHSTEKETWFIPRCAHALMQEPCKDELFERTFEFIERKK